eukprot:15454231-Alexandrium_andersonii.AAC.1
MQLFQRQPDHGSMEGPMGGRSLSKRGKPREVLLPICCCPCGPGFGRPQRDNIKRTTSHSAL